MLKDLEYYEDVPNFETKLALFSEEMTDTILFNRRNECYLPLSIKKISEDKGYGVIATKDLEEDFLVCSYLGIIGTHRSVDITHDSCFYLGWIKGNQNQPKSLVCEAK